jgi:hypothetical protein
MVGAEVAARDEDVTVPVGEDVAVVAAPPG